MPCKWFDISTGECTLLDPTSNNYDDDAQPDNELAGDCLDSNNEMCSDYAEDLI